MRDRTDRPPDPSRLRRRQRSWDRACAARAGRVGPFPAGLDPRPGSRSRVRRSCWCSTGSVGTNSSNAGSIAPTIAAMAGGAITTVAPSTTATALSSITTGLTPGEHGLIGYRIVLGGEVVNVLQWAAEGQSRRRTATPRRRTAVSGVPRPARTGRESLRTVLHGVQRRSSGRGTTGWVSGQFVDGARGPQ